MIIHDYTVFSIPQIFKKISSRVSNYNKLHTVGVQFKPKPSNEQSVHTHAETCAKYKASLFSLDSLHVCHLGEFFRQSWSQICIVSIEGQIFSLRTPIRPSRLVSPRDCTGEVATKGAAAKRTLFISQGTQTWMTHRAMAAWQQKHILRSSIANHAVTLTFVFETKYALDIHD